MNSTRDIEKFTNIEGMIGKTPLLELALNYKGSKRCIFVKAEYLNLSGSIKDRIALAIMKNAYENLNIDSSYTIVEATSGNTGIAFSAMGAYLGNKVRIYMPDKMSIERKKLIAGYGAEIVSVTAEQGGFLGSIALTEEYAKNNDKVFLPQQFYNQENVNAHYNSTAKETVLQMQKLGKKIDGFVSGIGTGGTIMGFAKRLKEANGDSRVFAMEPASSTTLKDGTKGKHRIEGISDEFVPPIVDRTLLDENIITVDDGDAILMSQMLSKKLGLGVGISSGANVIAAIKAQEILQNPNANIVTVFADDNKKYLSTDLANIIEERENYISSDVELIGFSAHRYTE